MSIMDPLLDTAPCGFVSLSPNSTVLSINSTLASWLGTTPAELQGKQFETLLSPGGKVFYQTHLFPLLRLSGRCDEIYLTLRGPQEDIPVLVNGVARSLPQGTEYTFVLMPVRRRERFEEELLLARRAAEEATARLSEANTRLQALDLLKDEILAIASHDIGGLVTTIRVSGQYLMRHLQTGKLDQNRQDFYIRSISDSTDRLFVLVRDLSDVTLLNTGQLRLESAPLLLSTLAETVLTDLSLRAQAKSINLHLEQTPDEPSVDVDYDRLHQVITNLVGNAIKFTPAEGSVTLKVERRDDKAALSVRDTGVGISSERLSELFAHFKNRSTPGTGGEAGSGLGLAIVRRLVELHGGELQIESAEGYGSTFTIVLPIRPSPAV